MHAYIAFCIVLRAGWQPHGETFSTRRSATICTKRFRTKRTQSSPEFLSRRKTTGVFLSLHTTSHAHSQTATSAAQTLRTCSLSLLCFVCIGHRYSRRPDTHTHTRAPDHVSRPCARPQCSGNVFDTLSSTQYGTRAERVAPIRMAAVYYDDYYSRHKQYHKLRARECAC